MSHIAEIRQFVLREFLPDVPAEELGADEDLLAGGVVDSLGLLKLIAWIEDRFGVAVDEVELSPDSFRSITAINAFVHASVPMRTS
jgi:acyl carrier protein